MLREILNLPPAWRTGWLKESAFEKIFALEGEVFRHKDGRRTLRFEHDGRSYFAKLHHGLGWRRFCKSLLRGKWPVCGADNEWRAIQILTGKGIATTPLVAWGRRGHLPATRQSFIITEDLSDTVSLEDFCRNWPENPPPPRLKRALIHEVAQITATLHRLGLYHCDLYICHFLLDRQETTNPDPRGLKLHLIDLHRVRHGGLRPRRWQIKDLAALHFSSFEIGLTRRDRLRFISAYSGRPWRESLQEDANLWNRVEKRGQAFYREFKRRGPR
ncbi:MAG: lipopolysaccharide core heptose(I) kinase RfaP [Deltaproteobacteria bacterium]|nr:lipopolysaccharide core heptose(I) kinase RfaP [Deltaproteobacteria bacterium]